MSKAATPDKNGSPAAHATRDIPGLLHIAAPLAFMIIFIGNFPNENGTIGSDYGYFLPALYDGFIWFKQNGLGAVPWFSPSFCAGIPFFPNPQSLYYSIPQFMTFAVGPFWAIVLSTFLLVSLGYLGAFRLFKKGFRVDGWMASLGAAMFILNGFIMHRLVVGHLGMQPYLLTPLLITFLLPRHSKAGWATQWLDILAATAILAYMIQAAMAVLLLPVALSIAITLLIWLGIHGTTKAAGQVITKGLAVALFAFGLSYAKLEAARQLMAVFPRDSYALPGTESFWGSVLLAAKSLFWGHAYELGRTLLVNWDQSILQPQEFEYSLSPLPLFLIAAGFITMLRHWPMRHPRQWTRSQWIGMLAILAALLIPLLLNWHQPTLAKLYKAVPVLKNSSSLLRWYVVYILPIVLVAVLSIWHSKLRRHTRLMFIIGGALLLLFHFSNDWSYYQHENRSFSPDVIIKAYHRYGADANPPHIDELVEFTDDHGQVIRPIDMNAAMALGKSPIHCYEPLFGYSLEHFNADDLRPTSPLELHAGKLNFKNPACYLFAEANHCKPGDRFGLDEKQKLMALLAYRSYSFQMSASQIRANRISLAGLGLYAAAWLLVGVLTMIRRKRPPRP